MLGVEQVRNEVINTCQVRVAGISIAVALTSTEAGRITMATQCHGVAGGLWGAALGLLLDVAECSLTRTQVDEPACC
jgi:rotatin